MSKLQCRFCLSVDTILIDIYSSNNSNIRTPATLLEKCIPDFKKTESASLPRCICYKCLAFVDQMNDFMEMTSKSFTNLTCSSQKSQKSLADVYSVEKISSENRSADTVSNTQKMDQARKQAMILCSPAPSSAESVSVNLCQRSPSKVLKTQPKVLKTKMSYKKTPVKQAKKIRFKTYPWPSSHGVNITIKSPSSMKRSPAHSCSSSLKVEVISNGRKQSQQEIVTPISRSMQGSVSNFCCDCCLTLPRNANLFEHKFMLHPLKK